MGNFVFYCESIGEENYIRTNCIAPFVKGLSVCAHVHQLVAPLF